MPVRMFIFIDRRTGDKFVKYGGDETYARYSPIGPNVPTHAVLYQTVFECEAYITVCTYDINSYWHSLVHREFIYR